MSGTAQSILWYRTPAQTQAQAECNTTSWLGPEYDTVAPLCSCFTRSGQLPMLRSV